MTMCLLIFLQLFAIVLALLPYMIGRRWYQLHARLRFSWAHAAIGAAIGSTVFFIGIIYPTTLLSQSTTGAYMRNYLLSEPALTGWLLLILIGFGSVLGFCRGCSLFAFAKTSM